MSGEGSYKGGDWDAQCFRCGFKRKASEMRKQWQGYYVCSEHWEPRHPQDFVRGVPDNPSVPWTQPENWSFIGGFCLPESRVGEAGFSVAGCAIAGQPFTAYSPSSFCTITGRLPQADIGTADCAIVSI